MNKKLYRSKRNRVLAGVCGGIGEYFDVDPVIIRLLVVVFCLMGGAGILAYIVAAIIIPPQEGIAEYGYQTEQSSDARDGDRTKHNNRATLVTFGIILVCLGGFLILRSVLPWIPTDLFLAGLLVVCGVFFIAKRV